MEYKVTTILINSNNEQKRRGYVWKFESITLITVELSDKLVLLWPVSFLIAIKNKITFYSKIKLLRKF